MTLEDLVQRWVRPEIRDKAAYQVPDASGCIKLDAMENPYRLPPALRAKWMAELEGVAVNRYPDPQAMLLKQQIRASMAVPDNVDLLLGNGSDEIIQLIALTLAGPGRTLLSVEPSFVMYRLIADFCGLKYVGVPLQFEDFSLDLPTVLRTMAETQPAVVFLACPNNPTGNLFAPQAVRTLIEAAPGLVVVDEAYAPFTDSSFLGHVGLYDNLVVMRTFSKMGLAGLRLGWLAGPPAWLTEFDKVRLPYNINSLTQLSVVFALRHQSVFDEQAREIRAERQRLLEALGRIQGVQVYPSEANFLLLRLVHGDAAAVFQGLKAAGVLVKNLDGSHPALARCLRVTVGTLQESTRFLEALTPLL